MGGSNPGRRSSVTLAEAIGDDVVAVPNPTVAGHLVALADGVPVGPGTPRLTVDAAAGFAALKLFVDTSTARRYLTQT